MRAPWSLALWIWGATAAAAEPVIAVAANLNHPLEEISAAFSTASGRQVRLSVGSSGDLLRQLQSGAPFEIYIAAASSYTDRALDGGLAAGEPRVLALATLVAFIPTDSRLSGLNDLAALGRRLSAGGYRRIAMANPDVAPFGVAAREALQNMGVWALEKDRVVLGENVAQAVQFTLTGGVDLGFIPGSYATLPEVSRSGVSLPIPGDWHSPLAQTMLLTRRAGDTARAFFVYLQSAPARDILSRYGYLPPP